jgi:hypothetical protein
MSNLLSGFINPCVIGSELTLVSLWRGKRLISDGIKASSRAFWINISRKLSHQNKEAFKLLPPEWKMSSQRVWVAPYGKRWTFW